MKFIYVFSEQDKMKLLSEGFIMVKEDVVGGMFVFALDDNSDFARDVRFSELGMHCFSDVLTF